MTHRDQIRIPLDSGRPTDETAVSGNGRWTHRIAFAWSVPLADGLRTWLNEVGTLEDLGDGEYAWTLEMTGDPGPGTTQERAGRAMWLAQDVLSAELESYGCSPDSFTHRLTTLMESEDPASLG